MSELNPFDNPEAVALVLLTGAPLPGAVTSIKGAHREFNWNVQAGTGSSGATTVFRGAKVAEEIEITTEVSDAEGWAACLAFRKLIAPKKFGGKPPTFLIVNILINANEISRVSIKDIIQPDVTKDLRGVFVFKFTEYNPSTAAKTGAADPAAVKSGAPQPQDAIDKQIADLTKKANAA